MDGEHELPTMAAATVDESSDAGVGSRRSSSTFTLGRGCVSGEPSLTTSSPSAAIEAQIRTPWASRSQRCLSDLGDLRKGSEVCPRPRRDLGHIRHKHWPTLLTDGGWEMRKRLSGWVGVSAALTVLLGSAFTGTSPASAEVVPDPSISGVVTTNNGSPVGGVVVNAIQGAEVVATATTDASGAYSLYTADGTFTFEFLPPTADFSSLRTLELEVPRDWPLDVVLTAPTQGKVFLTGQMLLEGGTPLGNGNAYVCEVGARVCGGNRTEADGYFSLAYPAGFTGKWSLQGTKTFSSTSLLYTRISGGPVLAFNQDTYQEFVLPATTTSVVVTNQSGEPLAGVDVSLTVGQETGDDAGVVAAIPGVDPFAVSWRATGRTDSSGTAQLPRIAMGDGVVGTLQVWPDASAPYLYKKVRVEVPASGGSIPVTLDPKTQVTIQGDIRFSDGVAPTSGSACLIVGGSCGSTALDPNGGFSFRQLYGTSGQFLISGRRTYASGATLNFGYGEGPTINATADIRQDFIVPLSTQEVQVVDSSGQGIPGVTVKVMVPYSGPSPTYPLLPGQTAFRLDWESTGVTGADGKVSIPAVAMSGGSKAAVIATPQAGSGWVGSSNENAWVDGSPLTVTLAYRWATLSGTVRTSDNSILPAPAVSWLYKSGGGGGNSADGDGKWTNLAIAGREGYWSVSSRVGDSFNPDPLSLYAAGGTITKATNGLVRNFVIPIKYQKFRIVDPAGLPIASAKVALTVSDDAGATTHLLDGEDPFTARWTGRGVTGSDGVATLPGVKMTSPVTGQLSVTPDASSRYLARTVSVTAGSDADTVVVLAIKPPDVASVAPLEGRPSESIVVTGSGFLGATSVTVGSVEAPYRVDSDTQITVTIPSDAQTGPIRVTNGGGADTGSDIVTVLPSDFSIASSELPNGMQGSVYSQQLEASGGGAPYSWARVSGGLPRGLALASTGVISGKPTSAGTWTFVVSATDAVGQRASKTFTITVDPLPYTLPTAPLDLLVSAGPARVGLTWKAPLSNGGNPITGYRVQRSSDAGATWLTVVSTTGSTTPGTSFAVTGGVPYWFRVAAINAAGVGAYTTPNPSASPGTAGYAGPVTASSAPGAPAPGSLTPGASSVTLTWTAPHTDGGSPIIGYRLRWSTDGATWGTVVSTTGSTATSRTVSVPDGRPYYWQVAAINAAGIGPYATFAEPAAAASVRASAPLDVSATSGPASVNLTWNAPFDGGSPITGYRAQYSLDGTTWVTGYSSTSSPTTSASIRLPDSREYMVRVAAFNASGLGPYSAAVGPVSAASTYAGPPTIESLLPRPGRLAVSWAPSADGGSPITGYRVQHSLDGATWTTAISNTGSGATAATIVVPDGLAYYVRVAAWDAGGLGAYSVAAGPTAPSSTTPAAPEPPKATAGAARITASWVAPSDGGSPITGYRVQRSTDGITWVTAATVSSGSVTTATISVTGGTSYMVRVAGINAAGIGAYSQPSHSVTPTATPSAPRGVQLEPGPGRVLISWSAPLHDGGTPITGYRIQRSVDQATWVTVVSNTGNDSTSRTNSAVATREAGYFYRVAAWNAAGLGPYSSIAGPCDPLAVPLSPASVVGTSRSDGVELRWTPADDGGSAITGHVIRYSTNQSTWTTVSAGTKTPVLISVPAGNVYWFQIAARNAVGTGPFSPSVGPLGRSTVPPGTAPGTPELTDAARSNLGVVLTWNPPTSAGGAPVTGYSIEWSDDALNWTVAVEDSRSTATSYTLPLLPTGSTSYWFRIRAINIIGPSAPSTLGPVTLFK